MNRQKFKEILKKTHHTGLPSMKILDENFETLHYSLMLTRKLPYTEEFLRGVNNMIESGIIKNYFDEVMDERLHLRKEEAVGPHILTIQQLSLGFFLFLISCGLSVVAFLIEVLFNYARRWRC